MREREERKGVSVECVVQILVLYDTHVHACTCTCTFMYMCILTGSM